MKIIWTTKKIVIGAVALALILGGATTGIVLGCKHAKKEGSETPSSKTKEEETGGKITLTDRQVTAPTANYDSYKKDIALPGSAPGGTFMYSLDGKTFSEKMPEATAKGTYTLSWYIEGDDVVEPYAKDSPKTLQITYDKKKLTIDEVFLPSPVYMKSPAYSFTPVNKGLSYEEGVKFYYSYDKANFTENLEPLTNPEDGRHYVYWYATGNSNYYGIGSEQNPIETYGELAANMLVLYDDFLAPTVNYNTEYTGSDIALLLEPMLFVEEEGVGTFHYSLDGVNYSTEIPKAKEIGVYTTYWYLDAGTVYSGMGSPEQPIENLVEIYKA